MTDKTSTSKEGSPARRVLVVDDDRDLAKSLSFVLDLNGYETLVVHNEKDALEAVKKFDAQAALLDVRLGQANGIDLIPALQKERPSILCIMITAYGTVDFAVRALKKGAYDYLRKPTSSQELLATLNRCFEKIRLENEKAAAENALRESETRFRAIVQTAADGIITFDERGIIESINPAVERIFAYKAEEMIGKNIRLLIPESGKNENDNPIGNFCGGEADNIGRRREVVAQRKDGSTFPIMLSVSEIHLHGRRLFSGIMCDIADRKQAL
ncbi:MAG: PAS domain S-box protein [Nitrospinales bacterium]